MEIASRKVSSKSMFLKKVHKNRLNYDLFKLLHHILDIPVIILLLYLYLQSYIAVWYERELGFFPVVD